MMEKVVIATPQIVVSKTITGNMDTFKQLLDPRAALVIGGKLALQIIGENGIETIEFQLEDVSQFDMFFSVDGIEVESEEEIAELV